MRMPGGETGRRSSAGSAPSSPPSPTRPRGTVLVVSHGGALRLTVPGRVPHGGAGGPGSPTPRSSSSRVDPDDWVWDHHLQPPRSDPAGSAPLGGPGPDSDASVSSRRPWPRRSVAALAIRRSATGGLERWVGRSVGSSGDVVASLRGRRAAPAFVASGPMAREAGSRGRRRGPTWPRRRRPPPRSPGRATARWRRAGRGRRTSRWCRSSRRAAQCITLRTRWPMGPIQAPGVDPDTSAVRTAILVRWPASRAMAAISTVPSAISGTSGASFLTRLGWERDSVILGTSHALADADRQARCGCRGRRSPRPARPGQQRLPSLPESTSVVEGCSPAGWRRRCRPPCRRTPEPHLVLGVAQPLEHDLLRGRRRDRPTLGVASYSPTTLPSSSSSEAQTVTCGRTCGWLDPRLRLGAGGLVKAGSREQRLLDHALDEDIREISSPCSTHPAGYSGRCQDSPRRGRLNSIWTTALATSPWDNVRGSSATASVTASSSLADAAGDHTEPSVRVARKPAGVAAPVSGQGRGPVDTRRKVTSKGVGRRAHHVRPSSTSEATRDASRRGWIVVDAAVAVDGDPQRDGCRRAWAPQPRRPAPGPGSLSSSAMRSRVASCRAPGLVRGSHQVGPPVLLSGSTIAAGRIGRPTSRRPAGRRPVGSAPWRGRSISPWPGAAAGSPPPSGRQPPWRAATCPWHPGSRGLRPVARDASRRWLTRPLTSSPPRGQASPSWPTRCVPSGTSPPRSPAPPGPAARPCTRLQASVQPPPSPGRPPERVLPVGDGTGVPRRRPVAFVVDRGPPARVSPARRPRGPPTTARRHIYPGTGASPDCWLRPDRRHRDDARPSVPPTGPDSRPDGFRRRRRPAQPDAGDRACSWSACLRRRRGPDLSRPTRSCSRPERGLRRPPGAPGTVWAACDPGLPGQRPGAGRGGLRRRRRRRARGPRWWQRHRAWGVPRRSGVRRSGLRCRDPETARLGGGPVCPDAALRQERFRHSARKEAPFSALPDLAGWTSAAGGARRRATRPLCRAETPGNNHSSPRPCPPRNTRVPRTTRSRDRCSASRSRYDGPKLRFRLTKRLRTQTRTTSRRLRTVPAFASVHNFATCQPFRQWSDPASSCVAGNMQSVRRGETSPGSGLPADNDVRYMSLNRSATTSGDSISVSRCSCGILLWGTWMASIPAPCAVHVVELSSPHIDAPTGVVRAQGLIADPEGRRGDGFVRKLAGIVAIEASDPRRVGKPSLPRAGCVLESTPTRRPQPTTGPSTRRVRVGEGVTAPRTRGRRATNSGSCSASYLEQVASEAALLLAGATEPPAPASWSRSVISPRYCGAARWRPPGPAPATPRGSRCRASGWGVPPQSEDDGRPPSADDRGDESRRMSIDRTFSRSPARLALCSPVPSTTPSARPATDHDGGDADQPPRSLNFTPAGPSGGRRRRTVSPRARKLLGQRGRPRSRILSRHLPTSRPGARRRAETSRSQQRPIVEVFSASRRRYDGTDTSGAHRDRDERTVLVGTWRPHASAYLRSQLEDVAPSRCRGRLGQHRRHSNSGRHRRRGPRRPRSVPSRREVAPSHHVDDDGNRRRRRRSPAGALHDARVDDGSGCQSVLLAQRPGPM